MEWSNLAKIVYKRTYSRNGENWEETVDRVIRGNTEAFVGTDAIEDGEIEKLRKFMLERKAMPAGRGLWFSGTQSQKDIGGMGLNNPLSLNTKILTKEFGWISIGELDEGQEITVLSSDKLYARDGNKIGGANPIWVTAIVSPTEQHRCKKITYKDKSGNKFSVVASNNHRWFVRDNTKTDWKRVTTEELAVGQLMPRVRPSNYFTLSKFGQQHGFHFGDGTRSNGTLHQFGEENVSVGKYLFGDDFLDFGETGRVVGVPSAWSKIPENEYRKDRRYLYGFLSGYFCADGHVSKDGQCTISSSRLSELEEIKMLFSELGIMTGEVYLSSTLSNYSEYRELYTLNIVARDLDEKFFLKESHRNRWLNLFKKKPRRDYLEIVNIEDIDELEEVACVTVPYYEQFVIEGFCLTSNCSFFTMDNWHKFVIAQDYLMLGSGVGLSVEHKYVSKLPKVKSVLSVEHKKSNDADFIVPDSREGWCELTRKVLEAFFVTGKDFNYSTICLRNAGEPIKRFGGKSSGAIPLIEFIKKLVSILNKRAGKHIRPIDAVDIICSIGEMVVSGNVRRSAIIILGDAWDKEYLKAKRWDLTDMPSQRAMANFSVVCDDISDLHPLFWETYYHGEPFGIVNVKNMRKYGRMNELKPDNAVGTNPCAEIPLADGEVCNLQEIFLPNLENEEEFKECARLMFRWGKRVAKEKYHVDITDKIVKKNNRIGVGITGCLQSDLFNEKTLNSVYEVIQKENKEYSKILQTPESIRTTTIKPSGTLSIMGDVTAGIHPAVSRYYIRRVRFSANDPLLPVLKEAGHHIEPVIRLDNTLDHNTQVVSFYCKTPDGTPCADEGWTLEDQLNTVLFAQKYWSDNSVSVTVYYKKEEIDFIKEWLKKNLSAIKTISFLCYNEHGFLQAPYEPVSKETYEKMTAKIKPVNFNKITDGDIESMECEGGFCPIK